MFHMEQRRQLWFLASFNANVTVSHNDIIKCHYDTIMTIIRVNCKFLSN